ncbi:MAG: NepR family anti-sigma factor [Allosphingosinicella sp.]|uniref:NepR family anti-sigma factor n=1 Tax=Allosphingosinicella sp. TaxID=2823234 RepID=UPI003921089E
MTFSIDKDGETRRKSEDAADDGGNGEAGGTRRKRGAAPELGNALRQAYDETLNEDIPPEMLDLLGKLG